MHRVIRDHLEQILAESQAESDPQATSHLSHCAECGAEVEAMRAQSRMLRELRTAAEPRPGFYARVMERIEAQGAVSIWTVFSDSPFARRIAAVSMVLVLLAGIFLYTSANAPQQTADNPTIVWPLPDQDQSQSMLSEQGAPDRDAVLVNLVTYREQ